jgi:hypothetical protein
MSGINGEFDRALLLIERLVQALSHADRSGSYLTSQLITQAEDFMTTHGRDLKQPQYTS